jgi:hypothetical protein
MDSSWQGLAWLLIGAGVGVGAFGLWELVRSRAEPEAFVPDRAGE